jgi:3-methyladenine DNA glycosylase/8-oxoguanine DNA glycosylase
MLNNLCMACGTLVGNVSGRDFHAFPSLERLCALKEEQLRGMGFGYRWLQSDVFGACNKGVQGEVHR